MENTRALGTAPAGERTGGLLYPTMLVAAMAVILFSVIGIAAMTGLMPSVLPRTGPQPSIPATKAAGEKNTAVKPASGHAAVGAAGVCAVCGVVSSIRVTEAQAGPSGLGAVARGVVGAGADAGRQTEKGMSRSAGYEIRVHMNDGSYRTFIERSQPALAVGQKVRITSNGISPG